MTPKKTEGDYVTVREAMELLGCSKATIYNLIAAGKLEKFQRGWGGGLGAARTLLLRSQVETLRGGIVKAK